ncbi:MAG: hypothetical protein RR595_12700 [Lysinibacillus sp.]
MKEIIILLNNNVVVKFKGSIDFQKLLKLLNDTSINVVKIVRKVLPKHRISAIYIANVKDESEANLIVDVQSKAFSIRVTDFDKTVNQLEKDLNNVQTNEFIMIENELIFFKHAFNATEEGPAYIYDEEEIIETNPETIEKDGVLNGDTEPESY